MKPRLAFLSISLLILFLALAPTAAASFTLYVDGVNGSDSNNCQSWATACKTIGHALSLAPQTLMVAPATYKGIYTLTYSLSIIGAGASTTILDGGGGGPVVNVPFPSAQVTLSGLTIQNGNVGNDESGGGILNTGTMTIIECTITGNSATTGSGGGIASGGPLTINRSTITRNAAYYNAGIAAGPLWISNSTISLNSANVTGGGIGTGGAAVILNSTITGNNATAAGGGIWAGNQNVILINSTISGNGAGSGGGIWSEGAVASSNSTVANNVGGGILIYKPNPGRTVTATLQNSILANNPSGGNCNGGAFISNGYNVSSDGTCNFSGPGDLNNTDPKLAPLGNNGGPTETMALTAGSPAIDAGNPNGCTALGAGNYLLKTDQRGFPRPDSEDSGGCDMGAYESQTD